MEQKGKNRLLAQIAKFGVVGVICFVIDYVAFLVLKKGFEWTGLSVHMPFYIYLSAAFSFCISVAANYILSMRFVFTRRQDMSRQKEMAIFLFLSVIGLLVNEACIYIGLDVIYAHWQALQSVMPRWFAEDVFFKFGATGVVMVYNFITRKMFLEEKNRKEHETVQKDG